VPVLAAVEGGVWGGACDVVACCDVVVSTPPGSSPNPNPNPSFNSSPNASPYPNPNPNPDPDQVGTPEVSFAITPAKVTP